MALPGEIIVPDDLTEENANDFIAEQIKENDLLIYMKGNRMLPQCGFSARVVEIFNMLDVSYQTVDVLESEVIREAIKSYSNWPTLPQVYYKSKFIGGCDSVTQLYNDGELQKMVS